FYQPETCELPSLQLHAPVTEKERAVAGTACVRKKAGGGGLWAQAARICTNAGQVVTGNQTPHFLSACKPNYTALGCQSPLQYITEHRACTGNPFLVLSARKSFPSKDAALSFYSAIYTVMYVTLVFQTKGTRLMKPTLCLVLLSLAVLVGVVRVTEHRNHWNDILAGFVTGGAIAAFLVSCVINNFRQPCPPSLPMCSSRQGVASPATPASAAGQIHPGVKHHRSENRCLNLGGTCAPHRRRS
uniref:Phosphatidic acid phosphatase type 2/haloperoxidase domain-containing protein n=1 Tax=Oryzias latipes TaxID=8090 RepID=A0A3P9HJN4_ORYLA